LLGPDYVLLRREFATQEAKRLRSQVDHVLVMAGGGDAHGLSLTFVDAVRAVLPNATITVVAGPYFPESIVAALGSKARRDAMLRIAREPGSVRDLMMAADLAVTSGGQTTYELAATGLPACAVRIAQNQTGNLEGLGSRGTILWAGDAGDANLPEQLRKSLRTLVDDSSLRESMSRAGRRAVDGRGASRVAAAILELCA